MNYKYQTRSDFHFDKSLLNAKDNVLISKSSSYCNIYFNNLLNDDELEKNLSHAIKFYINKLKLIDNYHVLIVGLGNELHTADAIGPTTLKYLKVNSHLEQLGFNFKIKISALEPGVLGTTGIDTKRIVESVVEEIKPDLVILIDSFVTSNIDLLNHLIHINNKGITPGSGLKGLNTKIDKKTIGSPVIVIGVPTALEIKLNSKKKDRNLPYLLSLSNIDEFVLNIAKLIAKSLNSIFY